MLLLAGEGETQAHPREMKGGRDGRTDCWTEGPLFTPRAGAQRVSPITAEQDKELLLS